MARGTAARRPRVAATPHRAATRETQSAGEPESEVIQGSWLRFLGVAVLCAKVALIPLVFDPSSDVPFVVPKALLSHGLAYVLVAVIAGLLIRHGRAVVVWSWLHVPVLAFLVASALATVFAADPMLGLYGTHGRMLGLASTADGVVLYFAIVLLIRTRAEAFALALSASGSALAVLGYEALQLLGRDPFSWSLDSTVRPFSTLGQSTALAQYLTSLGIGALACGLVVDRVRPLVHVLVLAFAGLLLLGSAATDTRSALIGVAAGSALVGVFVWLLRPSRQARAIALACAASAIAIGAGLLMLTPLGARLTATIETGQGDANGNLIDRLEPSAAGRVTLYEIGARMVNERPLLGYGPDNFIVGVPRYRPERAPVQIRQSLASSAHSWVVQVTATTGVVGLVCFTAIAFVALSLALRGGLRPAALAGAAVLAAFLGTGLTTVNEFGTEWLFWGSVGVIAAARGPQANISESARQTARGAGHRRATRVSNVQRLAPFAVVVGAALVALTGWNALEASREARASQDARQLGPTSQSIDHGLRATGSDGGRADYWHSLGLAYVGAGRWLEASNAFDRARRLAPYDVRFVGDLVQAQLLLANAGDVGAKARAVQFADEAVRIDPNNPGPHLVRAVAMQVAGNLPDALRSVERALALDPSSTNAALYVTATQVMLDSGRPGDAIAVARQGVAALGASRSSVATRIELARALVAVGKPADALAELDIALSIQPNDPVAVRLRTEIQAIPR
jgi:O-antigen ligase/tetratricopeptide (TPR) repeat protein